IAVQRSGDLCLRTLACLRTARKRLISGESELLRFPFPVVSGIDKGRTMPRDHEGTWLRLSARPVSSVRSRRRRSEPRNRDGPRWYEGAKQHAWTAWWHAFAARATRGDK